MKYKVGDKVKIKSVEWYNENKNHAGLISMGVGFNKNMSMYCGTDATITGYDSGSYKIDADEEVWLWPEYAFEEKYVPEQDDKVIEHWCKVDSFADDMLKSISEIVDKHSFNVEVRKEGGSIILTPIEKKEEDLPIDTPVVVAHNGSCWMIRKYKGNLKTLDISDNAMDDYIPWDYIIPFDKFNPNNIEESLKYNIVK